ncbi:MAG TPA: hypothetical protein VFF65_06120 [Phycisphaerales bacterium]|nr:hypothetical protein [Phycisphaerales bacterium]
MQRLHGQVVVRRTSPLAVVLIVLLVLALLALFFVVAVVAIPVAIVAGLGFAGYRALKGAARRKTNELLNRDEVGRQNVRVLRSGPQEAPNR